MYKRNIYIMYFIACLQGMVFYGPIATLYRQVQGVSILQITVIESISLALCLILEFPWGILADRIGYRRTMIICNGLYFVSKIIFWQAESFSAFLLERVLLGAVISGLSGVDISILYLSCRSGDPGASGVSGSSDDAGASGGGNESQHVFGVYNGLGMAGLLIAAFVYSAVIGDNYKLAGFLTAVSYGLAAVLSLFLVEVKKREEERSGIKEFLIFLKKTASDKYTLMFLVGIAFFNETHQTVTVFLNQLQYVKTGLSASAIGYIFAAVTMAGLCGMFSAKVTGKLGEFRLIRLAYFGAAGICVWLAFTHSAFVSAAGILLLRVAFSLMEPLHSELENRQITIADRATALSIYAMLIDSIGVGTNVVFGALAKRNLSGAFLLGAGLCFVGGVLLEGWRRKCTL